MSKGRILLVEDDAALAELLIYHFTREEFEVQHTPDGEEAMLLAQENAPDLVLLDWMIEGLSGIEVCRRLRRLPAAANVPIIMLTARGEEADRVRGLETGADDYVTKPFSPRELVARVGAVLRRVRPALAGEQLAYADIEMDIVSHKVKRGGDTIQLGPTSSASFAISLSIPAASSRASGCSIPSGATIPTSSPERSTFISGACVKRSILAAGATSSGRSGPRVTRWTARAAREAVKLCEGKA
jgi:DNA-binding response OmpR family regulator